ncbi:methyltransferase domain-containing protein [Arsenicicoccus sp. MKL-02]|uniref:Methyltransferase domain-containing protein n=1 Tax=Arsenicicoccus cauae TaxID=2663847 RepID=A0A6I3IG56_9MICO|nr:class I SAM-dependent methyltransferase [Arsenicicoccus cauae]MTB72697.1 methyltransferase domain-containing protein [Arsenicicoccus cauae]
MPHDLTSLDHLDQEQLWDARAAASYDTPGTGMEAPDVLGPTVDRLADLAGDGRVLELAVGTGRVGIPLARRGISVTGIEISRHMIARLREKVSDADLPVVQGDMASTRVPGEFSLVYLVYNTIGNLLTQDAQVECFRNAAAHLRPGGRFVIELWVPQLQQGAPGVPALVGAVEDGYLLVDTLDTATQRLMSHHVRFGEGRSATVGRSPHRYVWPSELDLMARLAGMALESRDADWRGAPFTSESGSHVSVYRTASDV